MTTHVANLSTSAYVRVNRGRNNVMLQAHRDQVRIAFSDVHPARENTAYHVLDGGDSITHTPVLDTDIWALALTDTAGLTVTELTPAPVTIGQDGKETFVTEFGEVVAGMRFDDVSINFHYGVSDILTADGSTGTGTVTNVGSDAVISCGTGVGKGQLTSKDAVRYRAGHEQTCMITHDQSALEAGVNVKHGILDSENGLAVGSQGTQVGVWFEEDSASQFIPQEQWNVDKLDGTGASGFNIDLTQRNLFAITYGYLSIAPIRFYCHTGDKGWVEFHNIILGNTQAEGHLKNPTLPVSCIVERTAGAGTAVTAKAGSWRAGTTGAERGNPAADRWFSLTESRVNLPAIDTNLNPELYYNIFTLRCADTFAGKANHVRVEIAVVSFVTDGNKSVEFSSHVNGALVGNDPFTDVNPVNSVTSKSAGGTVDGNIAGAITVLGKVADRRTDVRGTGLYLRPGDVFTLGARGIDGAAFTGDVSGAFRWVEEF